MPLYCLQFFMISLAHHLKALKTFMYQSAVQLGFRTIDLLYVAALASLSFKGLGRSCARIGSYIYIVWMANKIFPI